MFNGTTTEQTPSTLSVDDKMIREKIDWIIASQERFSSEGIDAHTAQLLIKRADGMIEDAFSVIHRHNQQDNASSFSEYEKEICRLSFYNSFAFAKFAMRDQSYPEINRFLVQKAHDLRNAFPNNSSVQEMVNTKLSELSRKILQFRYDTALDDISEAKKFVDEFLGSKDPEALTLVANLIERVVFRNPEETLGLKEGDITGLRDKIDPGINLDFVTSMYKVRSFELSKVSDREVAYRIAQHLVELIKDSSIDDGRKCKYLTWLVNDSNGIRENYWHLSLPVNDSNDKPSSGISLHALHNLYADIGAINFVGIRASEISVESILGLVHPSCTHADGFNSHVLGAGLLGDAVEGHSDAA